MRTPFSLIIILLHYHKIHGTQDLCDQWHCICSLDDVTPLIDCTSSGLNTTSWSLPEDKLKQRTVDINFQDNDITTIDIVPEIPVERLSFRNNSVKEIQLEAFTNLVYLSTLDLSHNNLTSLQRDHFKGPKRKGRAYPSPILSLDLSFNKIKTLPKTAFEFLVDLEELKISGNQLQIMESSWHHASWHHGTVSAIGSLTRLLRLNLSLTGTQELPRHFLKGLL